MLEQLASTSMLYDTAHIVSHSEEEAGRFDVRELTDGDNTARANDQVRGGPRDVSLYTTIALCARPVCLRDQRPGLSCHFALIKIIIRDTMDGTFSRNSSSVQQNTVPRQQSKCSFRRQRRGPSSGQVTGRESGGDRSSQLIESA